MSLSLPPRTLGRWLSLLALGSCAASAPPSVSPPSPAPAFALAHGVFVATPGVPEDALPDSQLSAYVSAVGKDLAYVYFTNNWFVSRAFPSEQVKRVRARGAAAFVRLMLRSNDKTASGPEALYTLKAILDGAFDTDLRAWGQQAGQAGGVIYAEYGTEMNGDWFAWNARWNGKAAGAALFGRAYRHIANVVRAGGGGNVRWLFHVAAADGPAASWNTLEAYYPGGDIISALGVSAYGAQSPQDDPADLHSLRQQLDTVLPRLTALAPSKPVFLLEFGSARHPALAPESWAAAALSDLISGRWPQIKGFSWWDSAWSNDADPAHDSELRVEQQPALAAVFRRFLNQPVVKSQLDPALTRYP